MMMPKAEIAEQGMYEVLKKLSEMGFHAVKVSQIAMTPDTVCQMQRARKEFGMWKENPILTHMMDQTKYLGFELDSHWM